MIVLPEQLKKLIEQMESIEVQRTRVLLALEAGVTPSASEADAVVFLHMLIAGQAHLADAILEITAGLICEDVTWPHLI